MIGKASNERPRGWAAWAIAVLALVAAAQPKLARAETNPVTIAHQTDRGSGRLVLEFPRAVDYAVERAGAHVFIRFSQPIAGDVDAAQRALARYVAEMRLAGAGRVLVLRLAGEPRMTHHRRGNAVVIVWAGPGPQAPAKPPENRTADRPKAAEKPPEPKSAEKPAAPRSETPPAAAKPDKPAPESKRADASPPKPVPNGSPPQAAVPDTAAPPAAPPAAGPALAVSNDGAETSIVLAWPEPTGAAVFRHGDTVWMLFSRRHSFDLTHHQKRLGPGVEHLSRHDHAEATVLAARIRPGVGARVARERNTWTVALRQNGAAAGDDDLKLAIARGANEQVTMALAGAEAPVRLVDPESGSTFFVVPSRAAAAAAGERRFVTFRVVRAAQGAVVEALADGLAVTAEGAGLAIRRSGGLLISGGTAPGLPAQSQ